MDRGQLVRRGVKRGTYYTIPEQAEGVEEAAVPTPGTRSFRRIVRHRPAPLAEATDVTYKDLHPYRGDGTAVDASFDVEAIPLFEIVYHHKAGGRGNPRAVNSDYHEGLELLLGRLALGGATILGISVDSSVALRLPPDERELDLPFPPGRCLNGHS